MSKMVDRDAVLWLLIMKCQLRKVKPLIPEEKELPAWNADPLDQFVRRMDRR